MEERRAEILELVSRNGHVSVRDLTEQFAVSSITIRNDLAALAGRGLLARVHGGARAPQQLEQVPSIFQERMRWQEQYKRRIGAAAAALVQDGESIVLDSSTTVLAMAHCLSNHQDITAATYSLAVANVFLANPSVNVLLFGGFLNRRLYSLFGDQTEPEFLKQFSFQKGFFGARGLTLTDGLTDMHPLEARTKQHLVECSRQVFALIDSSKWNRVSVTSFIPLKCLTGVITDDEAPTDMVVALRDLGIQVVVS